MPTSISPGPAEGFTEPLDYSHGLTSLGARRCKATANGTGEQCKNPCRKFLDVCRIHGGNSPASLAAAERRQKEIERQQFLTDSGFFNPDAPAIDDPVAVFAKHVGRVQWQFEFLGEQINNTMDCPCCGRKEFDATILRELRNTSAELGKNLDSMIKHGIQNRHVEIEQAKVMLLREGVIAALEFVGITNDNNHVLFSSAIRAAGQKILPGVLNG